MRDTASGLHIVLITMDFEDASVAFLRADGKEARFPLGPSPLAEGSSLARLHLAPSETSLVGPVLLAVTIAGDEIAFDLPTGDDCRQLASRPVVYLDQNQWSALSKATDPGSRLQPAERDAAVRLRELARDGGIILPASSAHYYETTKWTDGAARYQLGLMVLRLSRGWQLRDPLQVRRDELRASYEHMHLGGPPPRALSVITLMPNVLHGPSRGLPPQPPPDLPPDLAAQYQALLSATALIDTMLDQERIPALPPTGWAVSNQRFADWLAEQPRTSQQKRMSVDALLLTDLEQEIAEEAHASGITVEQMGAWLRQKTDRLAALPALGLYREVMQDRHLNKGLIWRPNDLTDMVYLSTAAAYADVVVCENSIGSALQRGLTRLGRAALVHRRLRDAIPTIERILEQAGSERPTAHDGP